MNRNQNLRPVLTVLFMSLLGFATMVPLLPLYARELGAGNALVGLLLGIYSLTDLVIAPLAGRISDKVGRKPVLIFSLVLFSSGWLLLAFADSLYDFIFSQVLTGLGSSQITVTYAFIADLTPPQRRTKGMGFFGMMFALAFIIGPPMGGLLSTLGDRLPAFTAAGFCALALLATITIISEPLRTSASEEDDDPSIIRRPLSRLILVLLFLYFLTVFVESQITSLFSLYGQDTFGWGKRNTGMYFGVIGIVGAVVQGGVIGRLVPRTGRRILLPIGFFLLAIGMLLVAVPGFLLRHNPVSGMGSPLWAYTGAVFSAAGYAVLLATLSSLVSVHTSRVNQGRSLGFLQASSSMARMLAPMAGGLVYASVGPWMPYGAGAALALATALLLLLIYRRIPRLPQEG